MPPRAKAQPSLSTQDARTPDTTADQGDLVEPLEPGEVTPADLAKLDPTTYGFTNIDTEGAKEAYAAGPGVVDPVPAIPVASDQNSTFAQRAAARRKVVAGTDEGVGTK
jgi:hypothetical protein